MVVDRHIRVNNDEAALSPGSTGGESYDEMLDRHHDSLVVETAVTSTAEGIDGLFASSVQNLYDANGKLPSNLLFVLRYMGVNVLIRKFFLSFRLQRWKCHLSTW